MARLVKGREYRVTNDSGSFDVGYYDYLMDAWVVRASSGARTRVMSSPEYDSAVEMSEHREFQSDMGFISIRRRDVSAVWQIDHQYKLDNGEVGVTGIRVGGCTFVLANDYEAVRDWVFGN